MLQGGGRAKFHGKALQAIGKGLKKAAVVVLQLKVKLAQDVSQAARQVWTRRQQANTWVLRALRTCREQTADPVLA